MIERDLFWATTGPRDAKIAVVAESWGIQESLSEKPLIGGSGQEFDRMLAEAGYKRDEIFCTNVANARPLNDEMWRFFEVAKGNQNPPLRGLHPTPFIRQELLRLYQQLEAVKPEVILACGNYALWALTHCTGHSIPQDAEGRRCPNGIESWRGSMWYANAAPGVLANTKLIPVIHPAAILRAWYWRTPTVHCDLKRIAMALQNDWRQNPPARPLAPPTFEELITYLDDLLRRLEAGPIRTVFDVETARSLLTVIGICDDPDRPVSIPLVAVEGKAFDSHWTLEQEIAISGRIIKILSHPNCLVEGQNFLYDTQYFQAFLGVSPRCDFDTMLAHHLLFPGTPKGLDYLSSLYCKYHWYWKDDGKEWDTRGGIQQLLDYNAIDLSRQYECGTVLRSLIPALGQERQWEETKERQQLALRMMTRGIRVDRERRARLALELSTAAYNLGAWFEKILPQHIVKSDADTPWFRSSKQQREFFGEELGLRLPSHKKTGRATFGKEALTILSERHPEFVRLFTALGQYRSIEVFRGNFVQAPLDHDDRMRCSYNPAGTETFRWNSYENAFGSGTNLQNIPKGEEDE